MTAGWICGPQGVGGSHAQARGTIAKGHLPDHGRPKHARAHRRLARAVGQPPLPARKQIPHAERKAASNSWLMARWNMIFPPALRSVGDETEGEGTEIQSEGSELGTEWPACWYSVFSPSPSLEPESSGEGTELGTERHPAC